jgi:hypothetical protein
MTPGSIRTSVVAGVVAVLGLAGVMAVRTSGQSFTRAANVAVDCEPSQRALVRQTVTSGDPQVTVQCVTMPGMQTVAYGMPYSDGRVMTDSGALVPAVYTVPAPAPAPRVVRSAPRTTTTARSTSSTSGTPERSWKKSALIIGGSAGTGAGVGAIFAGKKGAAIGAAIGGGLATILETRKH